jgi:hypothetical protein
VAGPFTHEFSLIFKYKHSHASAIFANANRLKAFEDNLQSTVAAFFSLPNKQVCTDRVAGWGSCTAHSPVISLAVKGAVVVLRGGHMP